jgi:hypothetical protein
MATVSMAGFAAASTVSFDTTGPDSVNKVKLNNSSNLTTTNVNAVGVANTNVQGAASGDVKAYKNTSVEGDVASGDASNSNAAVTDVTVSNSGACGCLTGLAGWAGADTDVDMSNTGPDSVNKVTVDNQHNVTVTNVNQAQVNNTNVQSAQTGNVSAVKNTTVGGLSSGSASNTNTTSTSVNFSN